MFRSWKAQEKIHIYTGVIKTENMKQKRKGSQHKYTYVKMFFFYCFVFLFFSFLLAFFFKIAFCFLMYCVKLLSHKLHYIGQNLAPGIWDPDCGETLRDPALSDSMCQNLRQPSGTPRTPNINNLLPFGILTGAMMDNVS